jgi:hypothetical protein
LFVFDFDFDSGAFFLDCEIDLVLDFSIISFVFRLGFALEFDFISNSGVLVGFLLYSNQKINVKV